MHSHLSKYLRNEWLSVKERFVKAWTGAYRHYGNSATSRAEGMHAVLKRALGHRQGNVPRVGNKILAVMQEQYKALETSAASQGVRAQTTVTSGPNERLFHNVRPEPHLPT